MAKIAAATTSQGLVIFGELFMTFLVLVFVFGKWGSYRRGR
jgi:Na+-translocating ferredoxin:NAD+ oxidoreductase RnfD subunit